MRDPKVLLLYPPNQLMPIETPRPDGALGLLYLAGALRQIGIEPDLLDTTIGSSKDTLKDTFYNSVMQENGLTRIGMTWERIEEFLTQGQYDIVGISADHTPQTKMVFRVAEIIKKVNPKTLVIAGGVSARNLWHRYIKQGCFDIICTTEGEKPIQTIVRRFQRFNYYGVPGTVLKNENGFDLTPPTNDTFFSDLDQLPMPAWDKLLLDRYEQIAAPHGVDLTVSTVLTVLTGQTHRYAPLMTSRGCPFQCAYCHISMERFDREKMLGNIGELRLKSVQRVLQEIEILESLGVKKIFIEDDSLLAKKARIIEIFKAIQNKGLVIADVNGVNLVHLFKKTSQGLEPDKEYMELLYNAGLQQIVFPVESGSQRILDKYATGKLNHSIMNIFNLVHIAKEIGIICPVNMMIGFPDETEEEMMSSIEMARKLIELGVDYVTFFIPIPFPGSQLYNIAIQGRHLNPDFDPDIMNWKHGIMENTVVSKERVVELRDWAWETVNTKEYTAKRLRESIGARWQDK